MQRSYSELVKIEGFEERFRYLALRGAVGDITFGHARDLNQSFYASTQWRRIRRQVIIRDNNCDLAVNGRDILGRAYIHHMNPMRIENLVNGDPEVLDPEFLISVTHQTHNAIHYGDENQLPRDFVGRRPGDTWI